MPLEAIILLTGFIIVFGAALLLLASKLFGPRKLDSVKLDSYECGVKAEEGKTSNISVKFYLTAILFIVFDIEILFLVPWAISFKQFIAEDMGTYIFVAMLVFLIVFTFGLFWEIKSKALEWE